ncbi:MAG: hypothetical protein KKE11_03865 [Gammaproteobacteria bacterium]|nr:hypothetical protein [Gammaproteobacteria bacterium]
MTKLKSLKFFTIIVLLSIVGCGFTPRSANSLPPQLKQVYYQTTSPYALFDVTFKRRLKVAGVTLLPNPVKSSPIINISSSYGYSINNPASSTQARVYSLSYTATISISDCNQKTLLEPKVATVTRDVVLQASEIFATTPQIIVVKQEMAQ